MLQHALVAYFDVHFSACHTLVQISTAPHSTTTHWKQTVFYLDHELTLNAGDRISGQVSMRVYMHM